MRLRLAGMMILAVLVAGCAGGPFRRPSSNLPTTKPTAGQLVAHLNQNAHAVQSLECSRVEITTRQGMQVFSVNGLLAYQKPRGFRLMAEAANQTQADFGSNDQEFWFWIKKADPALYHCSYEDFPRCRNLKLPLHPDWIAEALCVGEFGSPEQYHLRNKGQTAELIVRSTTPQGQQVQKITVVSLVPQRGIPAGSIVAHHLITPEGKSIWSAYVEEYQNAGVASVPRKVRLVSKDDNTELQLTLGGCKLNGITPDEARTMFARPPMPGVEKINLARGPQATPQSIQKVRGASD